MVGENLGDHFLGLIEVTGGGDFVDFGAWWVRGRQLQPSMKARTRRLPKSKSMGHPPGLFVTQYRSRVVIAYSVEEDTVVVIGVFYGGRDLESLLGGVHE
jgi:hypothetical protein